MLARDGVALGQQTAARRFRAGDSLQLWGSVGFVLVRLSVPTGLSATAQALVVAANSGLGWAVGAVLTGYVWDVAGGSAVFALACAAALAAGVLFWAGSRRVGGGGGAACVGMSRASDLRFRPDVLLLRCRVSPGMNGFDGAGCSLTAGRRASTT